MTPGPVVERLATSVYSVPTDGPDGHESDGTLTWGATTLVLVEASAGDVTGLGWTYAPCAAARVVDDLLAPVVTGSPADAPAARYEDMRRAVRNAGAPGLVACATSAVDIALWDLAARLLDLPLTRMWGREPAPVPAYGSGGFTDYDDDRTRQQVDEWLELGLPAVKIKVGEDRGRAVDRDLRRTRLVARLAAEACTDERRVDVLVDANGGYAVGQARRVGRVLDDLGVVWFEEPVTSDDLDGLRSVRRACRCDVTAGEYAFGLTDVHRLLAEHAVDCLQLDVTRCGGYTVWRDAVGVARAHHVEVSGHCAPSLTVPVAAGDPAVRHTEWFRDHVRVETALFDPPPTPVDGALVPASGPGHGLILRTADADGYRVA